MRKHAKMCESIGIERDLLYFYHRQYINKKIFLALTGYAFDINIDNGGYIQKIDLVWFHTVRISQRDVHEGWRTSKGEMRYDG